MQQTYEATIEWSVAGGPSGSIILRRGFLSESDAEKGARRYIRTQGVMGTATVTVAPM